MTETTFCSLLGIALGVCAALALVFAIMWALACREQADDEAYEEELAIRADGSQCESCGAVGLDIAHLIVNGKRQARCRTCKGAQDAE